MVKKGQKLQKKKKNRKTKFPKSGKIEYKPALWFFRISPKNWYTQNFYYERIQIYKCLATKSFKDFNCLKMFNFSKFEKYIFLKMKPKYRLHCATEKSRNKWDLQNF